MQIDADSIVKLLSAFIASLLSLVIKLFERKPNLVLYYGHVASLTLPTEKQEVVHSHSIVVKNIGKKTALNVRIGHWFLPPCYSVEPPVVYTLVEGVGEKKELLIPTLVPNEQLQITYLYFPPTTAVNINAYVKFDDGFATRLDLIPAPQPKKGVVYVVYALMFTGLATFVYWSILLFLHYSRV